MSARIRINKRPNKSGWRVSWTALDTIKAEIESREGNSGDGFVPGMEEIENVLISLQNLFLSVKEKP